LSNTWSLKYNLYYQEILGLTLFDLKDVVAKDSAYYQTKMNKYGIPLDNRAEFTKTDWLFWVGAMASDD